MLPAPSSLLVLLPLTCFTVPPFSLSFSSSPLFHLSPPSSLCHRDKPAPRTSYSIFPGLWPRMLLLLSICARLNVDDNSDPSYRTLIVLFNCTVFLSGQVCLILSPFAQPFLPTTHLSPAISQCCCRLPLHTTNMLALPSL